MTRKRYDDHSTEFGLWLRKQDEIDSKLGYITTNIDYLWMNYKKGDIFMLIEEKRYGCEIRFPQSKMFEILDNACKSCDRYKGFHKLIFENTDPDDGKIYLNDEEITKTQLLRFLQFKDIYERKEIIIKNSVPGGFD